MFCHDETQVFPRCRYILVMSYKQVHDTKIGLKNRAKVLCVMRLEKTNLSYSIKVCAASATYVQ